MKLSVALVSKRDGRHCLHCGATEGLTVQHRANRGMGGRKAAEAASNGLILCWEVNTRIEADSALAAHARACGWKVSTHADPSAVPYVDNTTGLWWMADNEWGRRQVPPPA